MSGSLRDWLLDAAIAALATAWCWSPDGLALTLPSGVEFHDGERLDALLAKARGLIAVAERRPLRCEAVDIRRRDRPVPFLDHVKRLRAASARLDGFVAFPDGLIRPQGIRRRD